MQMQARAREAQLLSPRLRKYTARRATHLFLHTRLPAKHREPSHLVIKLNKPYRHHWPRMRGGGSSQTWTERNIYPTIGIQGGARGQRSHHSRGVRSQGAFTFVPMSIYIPSRPTYTTSLHKQSPCHMQRHYSGSPLVAATLSPNPRPSCSTLSPHLGGALLPPTSKWHTRLRITCTAVRACSTVEAP
jgi:hypothetical protein